MMRIGNAWLLAQLLAMTACAAAPEAAAPGGDAGPEPLPALAADAVRAAVVTGPDGLLTLRIDAAGAGIGSMQGEVRFDPAVLAISEVVPLTGAFTAVNSEGLPEGRIRFAAFSSGALAAGNLLRLRGDIRGSLSRAGVRVRLEAAGTLEGRAVERPRLVDTEGVYRVEP